MDQNTKQILAVTAVMLPIAVLIGAVFWVVYYGNSPKSSTTTSSSSSNLSVTSTTMGYSQSAGDLSKSEKYQKSPGLLPAAEITNKKAVIKTSKGDVVVEFYDEQAPLTVSNFIFLSKEKFYDNLIFHRRVEDFVVQGGDPLGTGTGGPGYTVPAEITPEAKHVKGAIAMARLGDEVNPTKASSGSQFYITLEAVPYLDNNYTVFGKVISGFDVVEKLQIGDKIITVEIQNK